MRIAVLSDIHGNYEALGATLADMDHACIDSVICLGDMIGYGPDSEKVVQTIQARGIHTVMGNHELGAVDPSYLTWFNDTARDSLEKAILMLSRESLAFIGKLKPFVVEFGCRFVHGFPPDSMITYLFAVSDMTLRHTLETMPQRLCFVGHTHLLELISQNGSGFHRHPLPKGSTRLTGGHHHIINIGSVGQPRDGNHDAKYVIHDTDQMTVELRYVPYDIEAVVGKMKAAGLSEALAHRLL